MPNWKKLITSGSDAHLSSLSATSITGSLLGTASYALNTGEVFGYQHTQTTASNSWVIDHTLGTQTPVVQVFDTTYKQILPKEIQSTTVNRTVVTFDYNQAGYAIVSKGNGVTDVSTGNFGATRRQEFTGTSWNINHNLNTTTPIVQVYSSSKVLIPEDIITVDENNTTITFAEVTTGTAVISTGIGGTTQQLAETASYAQTAEKVATISSTTPSITSTGSLWWNDTDGNLYIQTNNPTGSIWVPATSNIIGEAVTSSYAETASITNQISDNASSGYMDIGAMRIVWGTTNSGTSMTGTYAAPFASTPTLTFSNALLNSSYRIYRLITSTSTGFTAECKFEGGSSTTGLLSYQAIGLKP